MPVAPHENAEVEMVLLGIKPLATIEKRKNPAGYALALAAASENALLACLVESEDSPEGEVIIVQNGHRYLIRQYLRLLSSGVQELGIKEYHRRMGRMFGYAEQDIEDFIAAEIQCQCSKCIGSTTLQ
jgi:hypothetical protein